MDNIRQPAISKGGDKIDRQKSLVLLLIIFSVTLVIIGIVALIYYSVIFSKGTSLADSSLSPTFGDFTEVIKLSLAKNPYDKANSSSYTLLGLWVMLPLAIFFKDMSQLENAEIIKTPTFWIAFVLFIIITSAFVVLLLKKLSRLSKKEFAVVCLILGMSAPYIYAISRGNTIFLTLTLSLAFMAYYNSEKRWQRELALLALAGAGILKIYPLILGIFLLKQKRWLDALKVAVYFALLFFVPFVFLDDGLTALRQYFGNMTKFAYQENRAYKWSNISIDASLHKLLKLVGISGPKTWISVTSMVLSILFLALSVAACLLTDDEFVIMMLCVSTVALVPTISYFYVTIMLVIPFVMFYNCFNNLSNKRQILYIIFFIFMFFPAFMPKKIFFLHGVVILGVAMTEIVIVLYARYKGHFSKKPGRTDL